MPSDILLHICCAPCGGGCVERLLEEGRWPLLYYSNSNILSCEEFDRRLECVKMLSTRYGIDLEIDPYDHAAWLAAIKGLEDEPEHGLRCNACFGFSLARAAIRSAELCLGFSTTLTVSPYKDTAQVFAAGAAYGNFEKIDFKQKDTWRRSCAISRELGFYRQKFCGCEFSCSMSMKS